MKYIDVELLSEKLRRKAINLQDGRILLAKLTGSKQEKDLTASANCSGLGRIRHFEMDRLDNWVMDPLPNFPAAKFFNEDVMNMVEAQVFQLAICNFRCWYCFVDIDMISANCNASCMISPQQLVYLYESLVEKPKIIDLSGGQPDLVPEWTYWMMQELDKRGPANKPFLWSDDNLSTSYLWDYLTKKQISYMAEYVGFSRVACFKGYDAESFSFNTKAHPDYFEKQLKLFDKLFREGFDMYAYVTFTTPTIENLEIKISHFMDKLQNIHHNLPLRTVPLKINLYSPVLARINEKNKKALLDQYKVLESWLEELSKRYSGNELNSNISDVEMEFAK